MRSLPRIHDDHAFRMVDDPCIGRKPFRPMWVGEYPEPPAQPVSLPLNLRGLDTDRTGLDRVYGHARSTIDRTMCGWSKWTMWPASGTRTAVLPGAAIAAGSRSAIEDGFSASCSPNT